MIISHFFSVFYPLSYLTHTIKQYDAVIKKYPILGEIYKMIQQFHSILFSKNANGLDKWMNKIEILKITEINSFIEGMKKDITAVKNSILYSYNNGIAEGSVNKLKVVKRIMYGCNSFSLLKSKILRLIN